MSEEREYIVEKVIYTNEEQYFQYRLTVGEFRDVIYLNIRKYFMDFEGNYVPSKEGSTFPLTVTSLTNLLDGIMEIATKADKDEALTKYFTDLAENNRLENE